MQVAEAVIRDGVSTIDTMFSASAKSLLVYAKSYLMQTLKTMMEYIKLSQVAIHSGKNLTNDVLIALSKDLSSPFLHSYES